MKEPITISEFEWIPRSSLSSRTLKALQSFDEAHAKNGHESIFDWSRHRALKARNYVGVIQVGDVCVEILPKVRVDDEASTTRSNLAYMLSVAGRLPFRDRDLAALEHQQMPFLEALISSFAERLTVELRRGIEHSYLAREENLTVLRGKLQMSKHVLENAAHKERFYVGFDEFLPDTWLNRIFKRACQRLLKMTRLNRSRSLLAESIMLFSEVSDLEIRPEQFSRVQLSRNTQRFSQLFQFAKAVIEGLTPTGRAGQRVTFSLLFPMEKVFEEFIGRFVRARSEHFGLTPAQIHLQSKGQSRWLLKSSAGKGRYKLKPDLTISSEEKGVQVILDTKWKRLINKQGRQRAASQSDIYQLFAYAERYQCENCILLYPRVDQEVARSFFTQGSSERRLRVEFINLQKPLRKNQESLIQSLRTIIDS